MANIPELNRDVFKDNSYEPEFAITKKRTTDGALIPAAGLPALNIWLSATDGGPTIHADVSKPAVERTGKPGYYSTYIDASAINAQIFPTYDRRTIYVVCSDGASVKVSNPVKAYSVRPAG